ncbi:MAG TPA: hypothetical protein VHL14_10445 [Steroidobacteraceae bacterium]|jgi:hypothetical protein|nr:hypothetical protein [Steroidobacteraceae bacterium]
MRRVVNSQPALKAQDFYLMLALLARQGEVLTYPDLAAYAGLSMSEVHGALRRAEQARLLAFVDKQPRLITSAFKEFLIHGARYAFPAKMGTMVGGVPTGYGAPPLNKLIVRSTDPLPVWPYAKGHERGIALTPLYPTAPAAALRNAALYENLALFDAIRMGSARERAIAEKLFKEKL